jgi:hypothetical protein
MIHKGQHGIFHEFMGLLTREESKLYIYVIFACANALGETPKEINFI